MPFPMVKDLVAGTPIEAIARRIYRSVRPVRTETWCSPTYWEERYRKGGTSGAGSYGRLAQYKAEVLNDFVVTHDVETVIEFGCGDGNQLSLACYPNYMGVDVSETAVAKCREIFAGDASKTFLLLSEYANRKADLALSLDVIFHLVEDDVFDSYMATLFEAANRFVIIYSSNKDERLPQRHVRHRKFTDWIDQNWPTASLIQHIPNRFPFNPDDSDNTSFSDFFVYEVRGEGSARLETSLTR